MRIHAWAIGLFLLLGIGFFTAILFLIGNRHNVFSKHAEFYSEFSDVGGLPSGAEVRVSGLAVGEVKGIDIPANPVSKFRLKLRIRAGARGLIRTDSLVSIKTAGVVGDRYVSIRAGSSGAPEAQDGTTLPSKEPFDIEEIVEKGSALLNNVDKSVDDIHGRLDVALDSVTKTVNHVDGLVTGVAPDIRKMTSNAGQITRTVNDIVSDLSAGKGPAGLLLKDEAAKRQLQATLSNAHVASSNLSDASVRANQIIGDLQSQNLASKVQVTLDNAQAMSQQLKDAIKGAFAPDNTGESGASNIRETLSSLNRATTNLAEDTEALKHQFLLRGYFKKRGFYNLEQLAPAEYLKACDDQRGCGSRTWLDAKNLFATGSDGKEQLVETGRRQIDHAVAPFVDSMLNRVVIVEGYCSMGTPDQQYLTSRRRADLVREYLETHFHLRHSDVGIVPLRGKPPRGAGRTTWNGNSIVLFEQ